MAKNTKTLSADVVKLSEELKRLSAELSKTKKGTIEYTVAYNKLVKVIKETTQASSVLEQRTKSLSSANKTHTQSINAAASAQRNFNSAVKDASSTINKSSQGGGFMDKFLGSFTPQKLGSTLGTVTRFLGIGGAVFAAVEGIKQITIESFKTFTRLEQQFASLSAISGATADQMARLQSTTFEVASSTGYAVDEVIQLESSLIKLGIPIEDVDSSIKVIAISARAMGEDLSSVGEILFKVSNQFGITQSEISSTASTLVKSINDSALTFEEFGTAIQYVGPIANQVGLTFRETAGYMEILSNAGFKASKIGTGLRDLFIDLKQPGETLSATIQKLANQNISLGEAVDLVGKTSAAQLFVLLRNADAIKELSDETIDANKALKEMSNLALMNAKNMNTTKGRIDALGIAWENYKFRIGSAITSTELFIDILNLLDKKSASAARSFNTISNMEDGQFNRLVSSYSKTNTLQERANVSYMGIPAEQKGELRDIYSRLDKNRFPTFEKYIAGLISGQRPANEDAEQVLVGLNNQLLEIKKTTDNQIKIENERIKQRGKYQKEYLSIEKQTGNVQIKNAQSLLERISEENEILREKIKLEEEAAKMAGRPENMNNDVLRARLSENENYINKISETIASAEDSKEAAEKAAKKRLEDQKKAEDAEYKRLKEIIETRKEDYNQKVESLELEKQLAQETGDLEKVYQIDLQLISERIKAYSELTKNINDSKIATADQKDELKDSLDVFKVNNKDITDSVEQISEAFKKFLELNPQGPSSIATPEFFDKFIQDYISGLEKAIGNISEEDRKRLESLLQAKLGEAFGADAVSENPTPDGGKGGPKKKPGIGSEDFKEELKKLANDAAGALRESIAVIRDTAFENLIGKLNAEKEAVQERYDFEDKVLRSQLDSQLITQEEYERKLESIKKKKIQSENAIQKKIFEAEKKRDRQNAGLAVAEAIASLAINNFKKFDTASGIILTAIGATIAGAQYAAQLSAINQRQFFPTRFAEGGVVNGPSHAEGGVPFSVKGRGGYEMEGGEFIVNKEATKRNYSLLRQINDSVKPSKYSVGRKFAAGGMINAEEISVRQIELLENIAYATGTTSINTAKPVRAFVSSDDLRKSDVDLRVKERNSNL
jgi:TP901 family phage tail tape measure protein